MRGSCGDSGAQNVVILCCEGNVSLADVMNGKATEARGCEPWRRGGRRAHWTRAKMEAGVGMTRRVASATTTGGLMTAAN